jgi:hypothetical protein
MTSPSSISIQNSILTDQINKLKEVYSTDEKQSYYLYQKTQYLNKINFFLLIMYYILVILLSIFLFLTNNTFSYKIKIAIVILLGIYPLSIKFIEKTIYGYLRFLYYLIKGEPYKYERK